AGGGGFPGFVVGNDLIGWDVAAAVGLVGLFPGEKVGVGGVELHLVGVLGHGLDDVEQAGLAGGFRPGVAGDATAFALEADEGVDAAVLPFLEAGGGLVPDADDEFGGGGLDDGRSGGIDRGRKRRAERAYKEGEHSRDGGSHRVDPIPGTPAG